MRDSHTGEKDSNHITATAHTTTEITTGTSQQLDRGGGQRQQQAVTTTTTKSTAATTATGISVMTAPTPTAIVTKATTIDSQ